MAISLSGCANVEIKDESWFASLGKQGAVNIHTISNQTSQISYPQFQAMWFDLSDPLLCTNTSTFAEIKKEIENLCDVDNTCTFETLQTVNKISAKLQIPK